jgi:hypothetical protein
MIGAAPLSAELTKDLIKVLPNCVIGQGYGQSRSSLAKSMAYTSATAQVSPNPPPPYRRYLHPKTWAHLAAQGNYCLGYEHGWSRVMVLWLKSVNQENYMWAALPLLWVIWIMKKREQVSF